jgi:hypothetical protein
MRCRFQFLKKNQFYFFFVDFVPKKGRACAASCSLLGAAVIIVGDIFKDRLDHRMYF